MLNIDELIKESLKNKKASELKVYRNLKADIMAFKTQKNAPKYDEAAELKIIQKYASKMEDAQKQYSEAGREDLASECSAELEVLQTLLPEPVKESDIEAYVAHWYENGIEKKGFDRSDVLIAELEKYYNKEPARIFRKTNRVALTWYLNLFAERGVAEYCEYIYFINDRIMLQRFIGLSKKPICDYNTAIEYMTLAYDYWEMKKEKLLAYGITDF